MPVRILHTIDEAREACRRIKSNGTRLGLVPTMGALHEGHLSLVRAARAQTDTVAASIFVNPLQFGPNEDFDRYPRRFEDDCRLLEANGVELVFAPAVEEMYPPSRCNETGPGGSCPNGPESFVEVSGLSAKLEGKSRPGHFRGVVTVVAKLFHILEPDVAFFGQKDAQQALIIRRMVGDLNFSVQVVVCPIFREPDGLAMSSRNAYLDSLHRKAATVLYRALMRVQTLADAGEKCAAKLAEAGRSVIGEEPLARLDYLEIVHPETLEVIDDVSRGALVVTAAYLGKTRLIDNVVLHGIGEARVHLA